MKRNIVLFLCLDANRVAVLVMLQSCNGIFVFGRLCPIWNTNSKFILYVLIFTDISEVRQIHASYLKAH